MVTTIHRERLILYTPLSSSFGSVVLVTISVFDAISISTGDGVVSIVVGDPAVFVGDGVSDDPEFVGDGVFGDGVPDDEPLTVGDGVTGDGVTGDGVVTSPIPSP